MIEVSRHADGITIKGHAGYAPKGFDIVCESVGTLAQVMVTSIEELTEDKIEYEFQPGWGEIKYRNLSERGKLLIDSFFIGAEMIANAYPRHVKLSKL